MDKRTLRRADLVFSIVLMFVAFYYFVGSIKLMISPFGRPLADINPDMLKESLMEWYNSPGLFPLFLSVIIFLLAICLFIVARRDGAKIDFISKDKIINFIKNYELRVAGIIIGYLVLYIYVLMPGCRYMFDIIPTFQGFPFLIATFIYLGVFMITFNEKTKKKITTSLVVALVGSVIITYSFGYLALVPLP